MNEWISVNDNLPKDDEHILMCHWYEGAVGHSSPEMFWIVSGYLEDGLWWCDFIDDTFKNVYAQTVTHWMHKPELFNQPQEK